MAMRDEAAEVYERGFNAALAVAPKGYKGQIAWAEIENAFRDSETKRLNVAKPIRTTIRNPTTSTIHRSDSYTPSDRTTKGPTTAPLLLTTLLGL